MAERKSFSKLSERQKRRRLNAACVDYFNELDVNSDEESRILESIHPDTPPDNADIVENEEGSDNADKNDVTSFSLPDSATDHITIEFDKLIFACQQLDIDVDIAESDYENSDTDSDSETSDDNIEQDIKYRIGEWASTNNISDRSVNSLLNILNDAGLNYLPTDVRRLRCTPKRTDITACEPGEYFHYGIKKALQDTLTKYKNKVQKENIEIDINIDGLPITKSPQKSLWPILGKIYDRACNDVFVIGAYLGKEKPKSPSTYLEPFINEYLDLCENGFICNGRKFTVLIRCLICDSPAASYILCSKQFNGYYGCRKCCVKGDWKSRVVFLQENEPLRTNESFREQMQKEHHNGVSPLTKLNFDMILQVPLDYMHLVCLGVSKLLLRLWIMPRVKPNLNILQLEHLSNSFLSISAWIPKEFARKGQSLLELSRWKATTLRLFLLYVGPIILQDILPAKYMLHYNTLSCSIRILCHPSHCIQYNDYAKKLLLYFVRNMKSLYGEEWVTWNTHNLIHLPDDAKNLGCMDDYSAFPFENYMQTLKRMLRKKGQSLQQIHRRLTERSHFTASVKPSSNVTYPLINQPINMLLPEGYHHSHKSLKFANFELKVSRPDNCCITTDDEIILISYICKSGNEIVVIGRQFCKKENIANYPLPSIEFGICQVGNLSVEKTISIDKIKNKACLFYHQKNSYVIPLLHHGI